MHLSKLRNFNLVGQFCWCYVPDGNVSISNNPVLHSKVGMHELHISTSWSTFSPGYQLLYQKFELN